MANTIQIGADTSGFVSGINRAQGSMAGLGSMIQRVVGGAAVFGALTAAAKGFYSAMEAGGALVDLSGQTGVAIDKLMVLQMAFDQAGMSAGDVQPVLAKLQKNVAEAASGSADAALKFAQMGVQIEEIQGLSADEQLAKVGEAISNIQNPAQRSAMAMEVFGKSGAKLLSVFAAGGMADVEENLGAQAKLMLENAGVFDRASDVLGTAGSKVRGLFVGMAAQVMPQFTGLIDELNKIDLTGIGESLGDGIAVALELLERTLEAMKPAIKASEKLSQTQGTYGGQAFMGMGGMGMGGGGTALSAAAAAAEEPQPKTSIFDQIRQDIEKKREEARKKYATPGAADTGAGYIPKAGGGGGPAAMIATSGAKVGALGGAVWGGEESINVQRDQLAVQQRIANSIDAFLKAAAPTSNPYIGSVMPQLGVI
jgi:hypothetical protein